MKLNNLKCAAHAGDGHYYDAADASGLGDAMNEAVAQTVEKPEGNFTIYATRNGEPIDATIKAYDQIAKRRPIGRRTYRDTASVFLPPSTYNIEVRMLESSKISAILLENVETFEDKIVHRDVSFDGGKIRMMTTNNGEGWDCTSKIEDMDGKRVGGRRTYGKEIFVEVDPGTYTVTSKPCALKPGP